MPVDIRGKTYWTVAERLKLAEGEEFVPPVGIKSIITSVEAAGNIVVARAHVTFTDGREFTGHSMVNTSATSPAERDAPLETAETSALGRALAFAGYYGSPEGIAGAEEIAMAQARADARAQARPAPRFADESSPVTRMAAPGGGAAPRPVGGGGSAGPPSAAQTRYLIQLWEQAGRPFPPPEPPTGRAASQIIDELRSELGIPPRDR